MNGSAKQISDALNLPMKIAQDMRRDLVATESAHANGRMVSESLKLANKAIDGYGVEVVRGRWVSSYYGDIVAEYVNTGDTYNTTILYDTIAKRFSLTSLGDFVERNSKRYQIT